MTINRINNAIVDGNIDKAIRLIANERAKEHVRKDLDLDYGLNQVLLYLQRKDANNALATLRSLEDKKKLATNMLVKRLHGMQSGTLSALPDLALHMIENNIRPKSKVARVLDFGTGDYTPPKDSIASFFAKNM